jgi:hypothetical protein
VCFTFTVTVDIREIRVVVDILEIGVKRGQAHCHSAGGDGPLTGGLHGEAAVCASGKAKIILIITIIITIHLVLLKNKIVSLIIYYI